MKHKVRMSIIALLLISISLLIVTVAAKPAPPIGYQVKEMDEFFQIEILGVTKGSNFKLNESEFWFDTDNENKTLIKEIKNLELNESITITYIDNDSNNLISKGDFFILSKIYSGNILFINTFHFIIEDGYRYENPEKRNDDEDDSGFICLSFSIIIISALSTIGYISNHEKLIQRKRTK